MKKSIPVFITILPVVIFLCCCRQQVTSPVVHSDFNSDPAKDYYNGYQLFFIRHVDTLHNDTLYSVCYLDSAGDTIRAMIPFSYENPDTTIWLNFYLRNNGDTIICDEHSETTISNTSDSQIDTLQISITSEGCRQDSITKEGKAVIAEIQQYLEDYQLVEEQRQNDSIQHI